MRFLIRFRKYDKILHAVKWGLIWGPLQGFCFLAPHFLSSHVLYPNSASDWFFVLLFLFGVFATIGVFCSLFATFPLMIYSSVFGPGSIHSSRTHGTVVGVLMPIVYLLLGYFFVWAKLGTILPLSEALSLPDIFALMAIIVGVLGYHLVVVVLVLKRNLWSPTVNIDLWLVGCAILVAVLIPYHLTDPRSVKLPEDLNHIRPAASSVSSQSVPLLLIGIDGANWKSITPLLNKKSLPTLERLIKQGVRGTVEGLWPPYLSGPAWAAMLTGFPREQTGIYEDLMVLAPPLQTPFQLPLFPDIKLVPLLLIEHYLVRLGFVEIKPHARFMLRRSPIWEILTETTPREKIAVIRFWFTHPPDTKPGTIIVSDWAGKDAWSSLNVNTSTERPTVSPERLSNELLKFFDAIPNNHNLLDFVDTRNYHQPLDTVEDPIKMLHSSLQIDSKTLAASGYLLRQHPDLGALMVYLGGYDMVCHAFWQYRFPEEFASNNPPAKLDIDRLGPVMDRYLQFLDRQLGDLIAAFSTSPNVLIVSDHGHEANQTPLIWRSKHAREGIFIAAGPDIRATEEKISVSYYDIVPTILQLFRLENPNNLRGKSVLQGN